MDGVVCCADSIAIAIATLVRRAVRQPQATTAFKFGCVIDDSLAAFGIRGWITVVSNGLILAITPANKQHTTERKGRAG
eukprot:scaffold108523_cov43-Tisochrysis_lutea.AAC.3